MSAHFLDLLEHGDVIVGAASTRCEGVPDGRFVQRFEWLPAQAERLAQRIGALVEVANLGGKIDPEAVAEVRRLGALLFDDLLPHAIKRWLREANGGSLCLGLTDGLLHLPWELMHDGREFLGLRWSIGRVGITEHEPDGILRRAPSTPVSMLIVADPAGDLPEAYNEGVAIRHLMDATEAFAVSFRSTRVESRFLRERLRDYDVVHFAGHLEDDGLRMLDGFIGPPDLERLRGGLPMPSLVFLNGCGQGNSSTAGHLIQPLLDAGVRHCVAALFELPDQLGRDVGAAFYSSLSDGETIGESLRVARVQLAERYGLGAMIWAPYTLFGDPSARYSQPDSAPRQDDGLFDPAEPSPPFVLTSASIAARPRLRSRTAGSLLVQGQSIQRALVQAIAVATVPLIAFMAFLLIQAGPNSPDQQSAAALSGEWPDDHVDQEALVAINAHVEETRADGVVRLAALEEGTLVSESAGLVLAVDLAKPAHVFVLRVARERVALLDPDEAGLSRLLTEGRHRLPVDGRYAAYEGEALNTLIVAGRDAAWPGLDAAVIHINDVLSSPTRASLVPQDALQRLMAHQEAADTVIDFLERHGASVIERGYEVR